MKKAILDTNVVIDDVLSVNGFAVAISSLSYAELEWGLAADAEEVRVIRAARLDRIRARLGAGLPFDDDAARSYGHITRLVHLRGGRTRGRVVGLMIAAIAHSNDAALVTRNVKDFADLEGLVEIIPA